MNAKVANVILESSDGQKFTVDTEIAKKSIFIKEKLDNLGANDEKPQVVPIQVHGEILKKVIEWMTHHKNDPEEVQLQNNMPRARLSNWDAQFFNMDVSILYSLVLAANVLDIKSLLVMSCKKVLLMLRGNFAAEIREGNKG